MLVIWICGNPATPALIPFGVMLELEASTLLLPVSLTALLGAVLEELLDALLAATGDGPVEALSSTTATDWVEVGAIEAVELGGAAGGA